MSLELAIQENTNTMKQLIAAWNTLTANATAAAATVKPGDIITAGGVPVVDTSAKTEVKTEAKKPAAVSQPSETAAAPIASKPEASTSVAAVTYDDVKALVLQVSKDKGRDAAAAVLSGFGVAKAPELKPEQYADAVVQLKAALA
ncbi:hypothetical protein [Rhodoferax sp.]|uniref:hypothetical protein n=1 Tax=Rhodoferax sp. TaxID=50421 RepID=UPI002ACD94FA|nr:hypothetical protein [Rhodoferax sp.]MDZ7918490.1 hypothetical protein [Rhodoferax sp.]